MQKDVGVMEGGGQYIQVQGGQFALVKGAGPGAGQNCVQLVLETQAGPGERQGTVNILEYLKTEMLDTDKRLETRLPPDKVITSNCAVSAQCIPIDHRFQLLLFRRTRA